MGSLLRLVGAIWNRFLDGYKLGKVQKEIEYNQKRIDANDELIKKLDALHKQREAEAAQARKNNDPPDIEPPCEMDFFIGENKPVRVQMSRPFWGSLQDSHPGSWTKLMKFVDAELERRKEEDD